MLHIRKCSKDYQFGAVERGAGCFLRGARGAAVVAEAGGVRLYEQVPWVTIDL